MVNSLLWFASEKDFAATFSKVTEHIPTALARLMERAPWSEVITKTTERNGPTRYEHVYYCFNPAVLREVETVDDINDFLESGGVEV